MKIHTRANTIDAIKYLLENNRNRVLSRVSPMYKKVNPKIMKGVLAVPT